MARTLSIVRQGATPEEDTACTMAEAAHAEVDRLLRGNPTVMAFLAQRLDEPLQISSLPGSRLVLEGMIGGASEALGMLALSVSKED
jgi:hypothetical protein